MSTEQATTWTVPETFPVRVTQDAHDAEGAADLGHVEGFCRACAAIYVAIVGALPAPQNGSTGDQA